MKPPPTISSRDDGAVQPDQAGQIIRHELMSGFLKGRHDEEILQDSIVIVNPIQLGTLEMDIDPSCSVLIADLADQGRHLLLGDIRPDDDILTFLQSNPGFDDQFRILFNNSLVHFLSPCLTLKGL
jgi:hypothetical protein